MKVFADIETTGHFDPKEADDNKKHRMIRQLTMTCFCAVTDSNAEYRICFEKDISERDKEEKLDQIARLLDDADEIHFFNGTSFDLIVLSRYYDITKVAQWSRKLKDLLLTIKKKKGFYISLDTLCRLNGFKTKTMQASDAPLIWESGDYNKLLDYCLNDCIMLKSCSEKKCLQLKYGTVTI